MPSTTSRVVSIVLDSSTVMTPSLPTFFMASAMMPPICLSLLAEIVPTWAMTGAPNFFSITALRPLGPRVIFTASARAFTPRKIAWRDASPVTICFAISCFLLMILVRTAEFFQKQNRSEDRPLQNIQTAGLKPCTTRSRKLLLCGFCGAAELGQNFLFTQDEVFLAVELNFRAAVFAKQNAITRLYVERDEFALFALAGADSDHFAFHRLFFRRVRDDDAA